MNDYSEEWDGVDRRTQYEVDQVMLERRLGHIEKNVAIVGTETANLVQVMKEFQASVKEELAEVRALSQPKRNYAEWFTVGLTLVGTVGLAMGLYIAPLVNDIDRLKADQVRIWERVNTNQSQLDRNQPVIEALANQLGG